MKSLLTQKGMSLVEMMVAGAITVGLGLVALNMKTFTERETTRQNLDIQSTISRYGGAMVLMHDLSASEMSFNFLNMKDDNDLPFFVLAGNELCRGNKCARKKTLTIPRGKTKSESLFLIVKRGFHNEMLKFSIDPISTYQSKSYTGINWQYNSEDHTISKSSRDYSPWAKGRLLMLSSELSFYDCKNKTQKNDDSCTISCASSGTCNYVAKRPMKFLGVVNDKEIDMEAVSFPGAGDIFNTRFDICRPDANLKCTSRIDIGGLNSPRTFFEMLPYVPGMDNRAYISPVEVIEYYLKKPNINSPDHEVTLYRSRMKATGTRLAQEAPLPLISGITSIQFKRANISNALIEYKLKKARFRKSVK
jgi:hypothetical protein